MFDTINGLPLHPLVVHAVVVLLPLATLGVLALALRPAWRGPYGWLVVAAAAAAVVLIPVATESGEHLEQRVGDPGVHADLGGQLIYFAFPLLVVALALALLPRSPRPQPRSMHLVVAVVAVLVSLANIVQIYRVGDSGAKAVWGNVPAATESER